jgi:hypothetical protein
MSGLPGLEKSIKSGVFRRVLPRLFASVHGVTVAILWSRRWADNVPLAYPFNQSRNSWRIIFQSKADTLNFCTHKFIKR